MGPRSRARGRVSPRIFAPDHRQRIARGHQVSGEEDRQRDLAELTGLEGERTDPDPDPRAIDGAADPREHRQEQQHDAREHRNVAVSLQHAVVAHDDQYGDRDGDGHARPDDLPDARAVPARCAGRDVDPVDLGDADPVEHCGNRQDERVGLRRDDPHHEVHGEHEHGKTRREHDDGRVDMTERAQLHEDDRKRHDPAGEEQEHEFEVAQSCRHTQSHPDRRRERGPRGRLGRSRLDRDRLRARRLTYCRHPTTDPRPAWRPPGRSR